MSHRRDLHNRSLLDQVAVFRNGKRETAVRMGDATGLPRDEIGARFDALARAIARGMSRREVLRRLGLGVAVGLFAQFSELSLGPRSARAATVDAPTVCSSVQAEACVSQAQSRLSAAIANCFSGELDTGSLLDWLTIRNCLNDSTAEYESAAGGCVGPGAGCPSGTECTHDVCCPNSQPFPGGGQVGCAGVCCAAGLVCLAGVCSPACRPEETLCGESCTDLQTDPANCGSCGTPCGSGQSCVNGGCVTPV